MSSLVAGAEAGFEPIAGYVLRDKIGVGGYGEVWLADAPGGLQKAIKFVFGSIDEDRAANELKSLQRIRAVHHPFILSLERIEVVDGHLIVVTELADGTLLDRFREFHERGLIGIPRDRLLDYMRDAADALDFLCQRHDLQHLDIKPANLLLVADRIKVADFGLIKDIQRQNQSIMGGMTPTYAAPEMFDGRPGRYADQYSLAIVYQEMLTGTLPFRGRTTAQLATEHLHKAPDLEPLSVTDRPILARALSKRPNQRYGSCREFVDALFRAQLEESGKRETTANNIAAVNSQRLTQSSPFLTNRSSQSHAASEKISINTVSDEGSASDRGISSSASSETRYPLPSMNARPVSRNIPQRRSIEEKVQDRSTSDLESKVPGQQSAILGSPATEEFSTVRSEVIELPPLDLQVAENSRIPPSLFIGIGGTGAEVLTKLRSRLQASGMDLAEQNDLAWLLVDTDEATLQQAAGPAAKGSLSYDQIIFAPLKSSSQYRELAYERFTPISRRFLYNVPRSQLTEGVRPLAMLAFLDHATICYEALRRTLLQLIEANQETLQSKDEPLRIYIVGSSHGATGSVLSIEFAFLVQRVLDEVSLQANVQLVLTAASHTESLSHELSTAAAVACMREIRHYTITSGLHNGIPSLPLFHHCKVPWSYVYLVHGGTLADRSSWKSATDQITDFLCMDSCTMMGSILDRQRLATQKLAAEDSDISWDPWLRTFGTSRVDLGMPFSPEQVVKFVCLQALQPWLQSFANPPTLAERAALAHSNAKTSQTMASNIDFFVNDLFRDNKWTAQSWVRRCTESVVRPTSSRSTTESKSSLDPEIELYFAAIDQDWSAESKDLDRLMDRLGLSLVGAKQQAQQLLNESTQTLYEAIFIRWLPRSGGWIHLANLLEVLRERFMQQSNSLATVAKKFQETKEGMLKRFDGKKMTDDERAEIRAVDVQTSSHAFAANFLKRFAEHAGRLIEIWSSQSRTLIEEFRLWSHALATQLDICVDASGVVRDSTRSTPPSYRGIRESTEAFVNQKLVDIVLNRFVYAMRERRNSVAADVDSQKAQTPARNEIPAPALAQSGPANLDTVETFIDDDSLSRWIQQSIEHAKRVANEAGIVFASSDTESQLHSLFPNPASPEASVKSASKFNELYLLTDGGARQSILIVPSGLVDEDAIAKWQEDNISNATTVEMEGLRSANFYSEGERISLISIINRLWVPTIERCQLAERVHSRTDVDWLPFS